MTGPGLYVHVPFCVRRCHYCGFAAESGREAEMARYVRAVVGEIRRRGQELGSSPLESGWLC